MANASSTTTIRPDEAAHFGQLAADWWDPKGSSAMLHRLNPVRLGFLRKAIDVHWAADSAAVRPLAGKRALDVGCGAGLLCEPLARLGASVTGVDAAPENIAAASAHAAGAGLTIDYRCGDVAQLGLTGFDLVTSMEVIEHVSDKSAFLSALAGTLAGVYDDRAGTVTDRAGHQVRHYGPQPRFHATGRGRFSGPVHPHPFHDSRRRPARL